MLTMKKSPYETQPEKSFWRTGMTQIDLGNELFQSLSELQFTDENIKIASVGSCFAQHVGRWLISNGFKFSQSDLDTQRESSFAFGNIYTPKCLLQWLNYDQDDQLRFTVYFNKDTQRYHDLLRPTVHENGFLSEEALIAARHDAKGELYHTIKNCDVLIFTLGLTEAWKDIDDVFYPSCPGVISGEFDKSIYKFHEFHYEELVSDIVKIKNILADINPKLNIVLTVSPVPLTATATQKHILIANQYSKSTLRSVAGFLSTNDTSFNYFPSYEIITTQNKNDFRFESNQRTVSKAGVDYVMKHFHRSFNRMGNEIDGSSQKNDSNEVICEEEQLAAVQKLNDKDKRKQTDILTLIGDSHMGKLSTALTNLGIPHAGGIIMNGSGFAEKKYHFCEEEYFVPLENANARKLWSSALNNLQIHEENNFQQISIIFSNIGLQTHLTINSLILDLQSKGIRNFDNISDEKIIEFFDSHMSEQLLILKNLKKSGHNVVVISDTPFIKYFKESKHASQLFYQYYDVLGLILSQSGISFINAAKIFDHEIKDPINYASRMIDIEGKHDWFHGGEKYYAWLAEKLIKDVVLPVMEG